MPEDIDTPQPTPYMALEEQFKRLHDENIRLKQERDNWEDTSAQFARNVDYYRGILKQCAEILGKECGRCDDGTYLPNDDFFPSRIVSALQQLEDSYCVAMADLKRAQQQLAHYAKPQDSQA